MAVTYTKKLLGLEDLERHDPATDGTVPGSVNRLTSTGAFSPITKLSSQAFSLLDAPIVSGAATPFEAMADTQAAKNVETALIDMRKHQYNVKNFEFYGGQEGTGVTQAVADKNRDVFDQLVTDITSTGRPGGIFFPPGNWLFDGTGAGTPILTVTAKPNIVIMGAGFGSNVRAFNASSGTDLLKFLNCSNIQVQNIAFDKIGTGAGANLLFEGSIGNQINQIRVFSIRTTNGGNGVNITGGGGHGNGYWIQNNYLLNSAGHGVIVQDMTVGNVTGNLLSLAAGGPAGISIFDGASAGAVIGSLNVESNILTGAGNQEIKILRTVTYDPNIHKDIRLSRNRLGLGNLSVSGLNNTEISFNELLDGGITYSIQNMATSVRNLRILYNNTHSATVEGIFVDASATSLDDWEIVGGRISGANSHGIYVFQSTSGTLQGGRISGVYILDCNQSNGGASAIRILGDPATTITRNSVSHNILRSAGAPKHVHGLHTSSAGTIANNFYSLNITNGWQTSAYNATGFAENVAGINEDLGA